jgi:indole-3-glycerol phosphate synthase
MSDILTEIAERVRERLETRMNAVPVGTLVARLKEAPQPRDLMRALTEEPGVALIAEVKRASPSSGVLRESLDAGATALAYEGAGAAAVSVLTEPDFFKGSIGDLEAARARLTRAPLLRKDFVLDGYQLVEARASGADAALLIVRLLEGSALRRFVGAARMLGLAALVEVRDEREVDIALAAGAILIGINNRDLGTLDVDLATTERVMKHVPPEVVLVSESGVRTPDDVRRLRDLGVRGVLVGTALSKAEDPLALARALAAAGRGA